MGESCFEEGLYEAARVIFTRMPSWGRLASTLVRLHQFQAAVDAARKANSPKTWKEVRPRPLLTCLPLGARTSWCSWQRVWPVSACLAEIVPSSEAVLELEPLSAGSSCKWWTVSSLLQLM